MISKQKKTNAPGSSIHLGGNKSHINHVSPVGDEAKPPSGLTLLWNVSNLCRQADSPSSLLASTLDLLLDGLDLDWGAALLPGAQGMEFIAIRNGASLQNTPELQQFGQTLAAHGADRRTPVTSMDKTSWPPDLKECPHPIRSAIALPHLVHDAHPTIIVLLGTRDLTSITDHPYLYDCISAQITQTLRTLQAEKQILVEKQNTANAVIQTEQRLLKSWYGLPDALVVSRVSDRKYIYCNDGFLHLSGYEREEVIGSNAKELNIFANSEDVQKTLEPLIHRGFAHNIEIVYRTKSGKEEIALFSLEKITLAGEPCWLTLAADITKRRQIEDKLRRSEERHRMLVEQSSTGIFILNAQEELLSINNSGCKILGYTLAEIDTISADESIHEDRHPHSQFSLERLSATRC